MIGQEIKMYDDDPQWRVFFNMLTAMYHANPVKRDIAGTVESISEITPQLLYKCTNTFYNPSNMFLVMVGDVDENKIEEYIDKHISTDRDTGKVEKFSVCEPETRAKEYNSHNLRVSTSMFAIGFKEKKPGISGYELLKKEIATEIIIELLFGKSSENYIKMYESGIIDSSFDGETELEKEYGFTSFGGESKEPEKVYETVKECIRAAKIEGFDNEKINRIKKAVLSDEIRMYNNVENVGNTYIKSLMKGINPLEYTKAVEEIDKAYLEERLAEHFDTENSVLSVVYPQEGESL